MSYPNPPNAQSGNPLDLWFSTATSAAPSAPRQICATQGRGFIKALQRKLNSLGGLIGPALTVDGNWGPATQTALVQAINRVANASRTSETDRGYLRTIESRLASDASSRNISRESARVALWVTYYLQNYDGTASRALELVSLPDNTVLPRFGAAPDDDRNVNNGALTCWDSNAPAPTPATREQVDAARQTGTTGVTTTTTGGVTTTARRPLSTGAKVLGAAAVVAAVVYIAGRKRRRARRRRR